MLMDRKTWYCEDTSTSQFDLWVQNITSVKTSASYSVDIDKLILKPIWRDMRHRIANVIL